MVGRSGYQILSFENIPIFEGSTVIIKGAFAKAKSRLPIAITELNVGVKVSGFSYDASTGSSTYANLPIIFSSDGGPVIGFINITSDDEVSLVIS